MNIEIEDKSCNISKMIQQFLKRVIDILCGLLGCFLLVPLIFIIWLAHIISKDNGPIFYTQDRVGKNGKIFKIYKFSSMVVNAEEKLNEYLNSNPDKKEEYLKYRKLKNDPRITKVGEFIRKTSIDEFPQFINILKGEMSLIGPRPILLKEYEDNENIRKILTFTPGLTGYWATNGRNNTTFDERIQMELYYVDNVNLKMNLKILLKTIKIVIKRKGAI